MVRLEQVRAEVLERFERIDRRFGQQEQRTGRIDQRVTDLAERLEAVRLELLDRLELLTRAVADLHVEAVDGSQDDRPCWASDERRSAG